MGVVPWLTYAYVAIMLLLFVMPAYGQCPCNTTTNYAVLQRLFNATGRSWRNPTVNQSATICSWGAILCSGTSVVQISLPSRSISGVLASFNFSELPELRVLDLSFNTRLNVKLDTLTFPASLGTLDLSNVGVSGTIPNLWASGPLRDNLKQLSLGGCSLRGTIPDGLLLSTMLVTLNLSTNALSGTIPLLNSVQLVTIDLSFNQFTGTIPPLNANISVVKLDHNLLSGSLPAVLPRISIDVSLNAGITGSIPAVWGDNASNSARTITSIRIDLCMGVDGPLPTGWFGAAFEFLSTVNVSWNRLTGTIPDLLNTTVISTLDVSHNLLDGALPQIGTSGNLVYMDASFNAFYGDLPRNVSRFLQTLLLSHLPYINGSLPLWQNATSLTTIDLSSNALQGPVPAGWLSGGARRSVNISRNRLNASLPNLASNVVTLDASWNNLMLPLPQNAIGLEVLDLSHNALSGSMNRAPGSDTLGTLILSHNNITSIAASTFVRFSALTTLLIVNNSLTTFPAQLPRYLSIVDVSNNSITGSLPAIADNPVQQIIIDYNRVTGGLPGRWVWLFQLINVSIRENNMTLRRVPKSLCGRLLGPISLLGVHYTPFTFYLEGNRAIYPNGTMRLLQVAADTQAWVRAWCPSWTVSEVATLSYRPTYTQTITRVPTPYNITPSRTPTPTLEHVPTASLTATSNDTVSTTASPRISPSFTLTGTGAVSITASRSGSLSHSEDTASPGLSASPTLHLTPTLQASTSPSTSYGNVTVTLPVTKSWNTPTTTLLLSTSLNRNTRTHVLSPSSSMETSHTPSLLCQQFNATITNDSSTASLYSMITGTPAVVVVEWALNNEFVASLVLVEAVTSWGTVSGATQGNATILHLAAPPSANSARNAIDVSIDLTVQWSQGSGVDCQTESSVTVLLLAQPPPTPEALREAAEVVAIAVAGPLAGAAAAYAQQSVLQLELSLCEYSDTASLSIAQSPTRLLVGDAAGAAFRGGIIGNWILVLAALILCWIAAMIHRCYTRANYLLTSCAALRVPGRASMVFMLLLQPIVMCATSLVTMPTAGPGDYILAALCFVAVGCVAVYAVRTVLDVTQWMRGVWTPTEGVMDYLVGRWLVMVPREDEFDSNDPAMVLSRFFTATDRSLHASMDDDGPSQKTLMVLCRAQTYEFLFGRLLPGRQWYFAVAFAVSAAYGIVGGIRPQTREGCRTVQIVLTCVAAAQLVVLAALRPYSSPCDTVFAAVMGALSLVSGATMIAGAPQVSDILSFFQLGASMLRTVLIATHATRRIIQAKQVKWDKKHRRATSSSDAEHSSSGVAFSSFDESPSSSRLDAHALETEELLSMSFVVKSHERVPPGMVVPEDACSGADAPAAATTTVVAPRRGPRPSPSQVLPLQAMSTDDVVHYLTRNDVRKSNETAALPTTTTTTLVGSISVRNRLINAVCLITNDALTRDVPRHVTPLTKS